MSARARGFLAALACCYLAIGSLARVTGLTPKGVHCPTAPVQEVAVEQGEPGSPEAPQTFQTRKPKPGDPGFVQCQCAEKKAASAEAAKEKSSGSEPFTPSLEPPSSQFRILAPALRCPWPRMELDERVPSLARAPQCPPPKA